MQVLNFDHRKVVFYKCYTGVCDGWQGRGIVTVGLYTLCHEWTKFLLKGSFQHFSYTEVAT
jgi:hypothetical protein